MTASSVKDQTNTEYILKDEERTRCEVWTRVMGYHRPMTAFNFNKEAELAVAPPSKQACKT